MLVLFHPIGFTSQSVDWHSVQARAVRHQEVFQPGHRPQQFRLQPCDPGALQPQGGQIVQSGKLFEGLDI